MLLVLLQCLFVKGERLETSFYFVTTAFETLLFLDHFLGCCRGHTVDDINPALPHNTEYTTIPIV